MAEQRNSQKGIENSGFLTVGQDVSIRQEMSSEMHADLRKEIEAALKPVAAAIASEHPESTEGANEKLRDLSTVLEKGKGSGLEDKKAAGLLESLHALAPKAVSAIVKAFATPLLAGLTGPATEYILEKMHASGIGT